LNTIRNNLEHREIYPGHFVIKKLIPEVEKFLKWILIKVFNKAIELRSISSADLDKVFEDFDNWKKGKLSENGLHKKQIIKECLYLL